MKKGKLIALEGVDCCGKSSIIENLKIVLPAIYNNEKFLFTREPGSLLSNVNTSEEIRKKLLNNEMSAKEQMDLFAESRYHHTKEIVEAINNGYNVITDRYLLSSVVYQGIELGELEVIMANKESILLLEQNNIPLINIVVPISKHEYFKRIKERDEDTDSLETVDESIAIGRIDRFNDIVKSKECMLTSILNSTSIIDLDTRHCNTIENNTVKTLEIINRYL